MISNAVKSKSMEVKEKVKDYISYTSSAESNIPATRFIILYEFIFIFMFSIFMK